MKYLLLAGMLFSFNSQAAVGWYFNGELTAIQEAVQDASYQYPASRASHLKSVTKIKGNKFKVELTMSNRGTRRAPRCIFILKKVKVQRNNMTGPNSKVKFRLIKNQSICK